MILRNLECASGVLVAIILELVIRGGAMLHDMMTNEI